MPKSKLPAEPRNHYVWSEVKISLEELAKIYKGKKGCGIQSLKTRSSAENWPKQRDEFWTETKQKIDQKQQDKISDRLSRLNVDHNGLVTNVLGMHKAMLAQYIEEDPKTREKKVNCKASELARLSHSLVELIQTQRLVHNLQPTKPMDEETGEVIDPDTKIEIVFRDAQNTGGKNIG